MDTNKVIYISVGVPWACWSSGVAPRFTWWVDVFQRQVALAFWSQFKYGSWKKKEKKPNWSRAFVCPDLGMSLLVRTVQYHYCFVGQFNFIYCVALASKLTSDSLL